MKNSTLFIFCTLFISLAGSAQTNITGSISTNTTFTEANSPYVIVNSIEVSPGITLTIEPGVTVKFNAGTYLHVRGTLNASGASFTGNAGVTKGFWDGIYVSYEYYETGSVSLNNCTVEYASNLYVRKGQMTLHKCTVNNLSGSVRISDQGILNIDSTRISNTNFPITYYGAGTINPGKGLELINNTYNFVDIDFSEVNQLLWLKNFGYPYYNDNSIQVRAAGTLQIDPGVDLQVHNTEIDVYGKIKAVGTKDKPIIFEKTSWSSYWTGLNILDSSIDTACVVKNCVFKNANYNYYEWYAALEIGSASPVIDSCRFTGNAFNLNITGISKPVISNCVLGPSITTAGEVFNVVMDMNANPILTNDSINFNATEIRAIGLRGTTVTGHAQLKKLSFAGLNNISYCLYDNTVILDTASVNIDPGVVIKCRYYYSLISANGRLTGIGTTAEPIVFTHIADDTYGNPADSQNDGTQSIGNSNGGRIDLASTAVSKLENWKFNYAGYNSGNWAIYVRNDNVVNKCEIKNSYNGIWFTKNAQVTNNTFINIPQYPIGYDLSNGTPNIQGNTLTNVGYIGIQLDGVEPGSPTLKKMDFAGYTNLSYIMTHGITITNGNTLTINPGVVIKSQRYGHAFEVNGAIKAIGTKTEKIIFTSINDDSAWGDTNNNGTGSVPNNYDWYGFNFTGAASDTDNILRNCEIRYCGGGWDIDTPVQITDCHVLMDSVKINFTNQCGMSVYGTANPEIKDCEFYNVLWEPIYMDMFANPTFTGTNKLANIGDISIKLRAGTVNGTVPIRSFAGYNPISYSWWDDALTVNNELTIPAGLTFKGSGRWNITGKLNILGTATNPVVFTTVEDDAYGNPKDSQQNGVTGTNNNGPYFVFYDSSNDSSIIDHAIFRYNRTTPIQLNNASPAIQNCRFENYSPSYTGVSLVGNSTPSIDNCTFNNIGYPFNTSLLTYPRSTVGNVISGTTARAVRVNDETLTQDATLTKRSFAGIANIPYVFNNYTVGTAAKLTIDPGVVSKFISWGYFNVSNGLIAVGGNSPDSVIVFTSDRDNFYGGDTHNNGDASAPWNYAWQGIYFTNESIDETCKLKNCIIKYASYPDSRAAVTMDNASPTIQNCRFENDYYGMIAFNAISPVITGCDYINMDVNGYAVWNKSTNDITVSNSWFNSNTGPRNATSNPTGTGERVTDHVSFMPFVTNLNKAELGDVSFNGTINPYDASLILQYAVSNITLNPAQQKVADVSGNGTIASYDASLILQYNVGLTATFTPNPSLIRHLAPAVQGLTNVAFANLQPAQNSGEFIIPVSLHTGANVKSLDMNYTFNPNHIKLLNVSSSKLNSDILLVRTDQTDNGKLAVSLASAYDLGLDNDFVYLTFKLLNTGIASSEIMLTSAIANESPVALNSPAILVDTEIISSLETAEMDQFMNVWVSGNKMNVEYDTQMPFKNMALMVTDIAGRTMYSRNFNDTGEIKHVLQIPLSEMGILQKGVYVIRINVDSRSFSKKLVVNW
ncbi:MAG: dockerin type I repeat-containing protein [Paludibacter sp.]|nr:dockerin type I repeat-containing protein [Paludibacter sp.]